MNFVKLRRVAVSQNEIPAKMHAMAPRAKKTGRPSKGPRKPFGVKLHELEAEKVQLLKDLGGPDQTYQDILEPIIAAALAAVDLDELRAKAAGQETLDIAV